MDTEYMDLYGLLTRVKDEIEAAIPDSVWVRAEIASISVRRNGHCYMDIVQSEGGSVVAQARAIAWAGVYGQIAPYFESVTGAPLSIGQQVLLRVRVNYSQNYGFSLIVDDIDPEYTLGDAQRVRMETLERLRREGLLETQRELVLADLPYSLAVISAPDAAGYRDFTRHLEGNQYGYRFGITLYPATMQGAGCAASIAGALGEIASSGRNYDAVLILRGGGGKLDLACYDEYELCAAVALHPFPVLTAVGHDQDVHLCDMVAYEALKTPTALADRFIEIYADSEAGLNELRQRLKNARMTRLTLMQGRLDVLRARLEAADPRRLLEKGFVLVLGSDDHLLKKASDARVGDSVTLLMKDGRVRTRIEKVEL
ncbi:MAG: exodeoxyribonuclease VII large subunit [Bacteroidales bacterium]|nr:exodeoxyribonuclease VII large subunit [Bacteroidales bacterium]